ncbi:MAG: hypothetical protein ACRDLF_07520 [Solirubrobacteraceae bacterium]
MLDEDQAREYTAGLEKIVQRHNRATDGGILLAYEYVAVVAVKRP